MKQHKIKVRVPATSANLGPGFDILGVALKLYNEIELTESNKKNSSLNFIEVKGEGKSFLPRDEKNIVWQAMKTVFNFYYGARWETKLVPCGLKIKMVNNVPIGAGLGSSAAAHLCGILAANEVIGRKLSEGDIITLAAKLEGHSDNVVPAKVGGLCASVSTEEGIEYLKLRTPELKAVVCVPDFQLPTNKSRKVLPNKVSRSAAVFNCERLCLLIAAFQSKRYDRLSIAMQDKLHQPYRAHLVPGMKDVFEAAQNAGAFGAALSGSGPSIIALSPAKKAIAVSRAMQNVWKKKSIKSKKYILGCDTEGAKIWR